MKQITRNYYELLNVSRDATRAEIDEAHVQAKKIYRGDNVAVYSLYSEEEKEALSKQIQEAYETLADPAKRTEYNLKLDNSNDEYDTAEFDVSSLQTKPVPTDTGRAGETVKFLRHTKLKTMPVVADDKKTIVAEQYRILFSKIENIYRNTPCKVFAVTSAVKGEGKSVTSINLAYLIGTEFKRKTIIVECDLRQPSNIMHYLENPCDIGLTDVLEGRQSLESAVVGVEDSSLYVLPMGKITKKSAELLYSYKLEEILKVLRDNFDFVIIDSPPVLPFVDMEMISKVVDGIIFVVRMGMARKDLITKAVNSIAKGKIAGIVLNGAAITKSAYYY